MLQFFDEPQRNLRLQDHFPGYTDKEVREMLYALDRAGLIWRVRGEGPGSIYHTTDDGVLCREALEQLEEEDNRDNNP